MKWTKYWMIRIQSELQQKTVVNFLGTKYIVSGRIVKRFGQ